jgi:tRNA-dihydrouridine synthase A
VVNGGITTQEAIASHLAHVDGAMLGREVYHHPWMMTEWDRRFFGEASPAICPDAVEEAMVAYMEQEARDDGTPWYPIARHMLGLRHGQRGARLWRGHPRPARDRCHPRRPSRGNRGLRGGGNLLGRVLSR